MQGAGKKQGHKLARREKTQPNSDRREGLSRFFDRQPSSKLELVWKVTYKNTIVKQVHLVQIKLASSEQHERQISFGSDSHHGCRVKRSVFSRSVA